MPETIPLLEARRRSSSSEPSSKVPWIEEVRPGRAYPTPGRNASELAYRRPVALVERPRASRVYLVDAQAVILPPDDVDTDDQAIVRDQGLIEINGRPPGGSARPAVRHHVEAAGRRCTTSRRGTNESRRPPGWPASCSIGCARSTGCLTRRPRVCAHQPDGLPMLADYSSRTTNDATSSGAKPRARRVREA